ncbi:penicillin-binding protein activator LpoB [Helicobacter sp. 23-1048]
MKRTLRFCVIFLALFFIACGTNQPQYVDSRDFVSFGLDNHDIGDMLQKQVDSLLNHPTIKKQNKPKVLTIGAIENKTNDNIDIEIIANELTRHLSNSGKFVIVNAGRDKKIEQIIKDSRKLRQNAEYNQYTTIEEGNLSAPEYAITGKITQRTKAIGDDEINEYVFSFTLTDLQLGAVRWADTKQISKKLPKKEVANFNANLNISKPTDSQESTANSAIDELVKYETNRKNYLIFGFDIGLFNKGLLDIGTFYTDAGRNHPIGNGDESNLNTFPLNIRMGYLRNMDNSSIAINALYNSTIDIANESEFNLDGYYMRTLDIRSVVWVQKVGGEIVKYWRFSSNKNKESHFYLGVAVNKSFDSKINIKINATSGNKMEKVNVERKLDAFDATLKLGWIWYINKNMGFTYELNYNFPFGGYSLTSGFGWLVLGLQWRL